MSKLDLSARVVKSPDGEDHLFIRTKQSCEIDLHVDALKQIKTSEVRACRHDSGREQDLVLDLVSIIKSLPGANVPVSKWGTISCINCLSDMQAVLTRESRACVFTTVELIAWRDLGPRGSHSNPIWTSQTSPYRRDTFARGSGEYAFGTESLKEVWFKGKERFLT
jgi:hypothetical protein